MKNYTCYFFDDIINTKMSDSDRFKANKNSYKNILIFYFGFVTVRGLEYVKFNSVYPLYLIINKVNGYLKKLVEINI